MATQSKTTENPDIDPEENQRADKPAQRGIWVDIHRWRKLQLIRDELGNWNLFADVAIEQLLASGLISDETRKAIYKINRENGIDFLDDSSWRNAFQIREPWLQTSTNIRKIREGIEEIHADLQELSQTVEDHATSMLEAELIKPDPITDEADDT
jgi:methyl-accepting chemotaxis protein